MKKTPVVILLHARPQYGIRVIDSLKNQVGDRDVFIIIDGINKNAPYLAQYIFANYDYAKENIPHATIAFMKENFGIATITRMARTTLFDTFDQFFFFEEDCVCSPNYIRNLDLMAEQFKNDYRVGMVSCFGEYHREKHDFDWLIDAPVKSNSECPYRSTPSLAVQKNNCDNIIGMHHNWGYCIFKRAYTATLNDMNEYYSLIADYAYISRPHQKIYAWLSTKGIVGAVSSQDSVFASLLATHGLARISSFTTCMSHIGKFGFHTTPDVFAREAWEKLPRFNDELTFPTGYNDRHVDVILNSQKKMYGLSDPLFDKVTKEST